MAIVPTRVAQFAIRILVLLGCLAVLLVAIVAGWLTFYTSDLPDIRRLSSFAPEVPAVVDAYICNEKTTVKAIQTTQMTDVRNALLASEGDVDQRSAVRRLHAYLLDFGPGVYGIENAAEYYLEKPANQLSIAEAALLVGLIRSPSWFSPLAHPDNALMRRNEVIDRMATRGSISPEQASKAKSMPLGTATDGPRPHL